MPPRNMLFLLLTAIASMACYLKAERNRYAAQIAEAMKIVDDLYVEDVKPRQLFENAVTGMVEGLDQYSSYIGPDSFRQMEQSLDQEFGGVGIEVEKENDDSPILVLNPLFDSPGFRAGLRTGDRIFAIDGHSTVGMKQKDAVNLMRGKPGSRVQLTVRHAGSEESVAIDVERAIILVNSLLGDSRQDDGTWDFHWRADPRIGYLRLTTFGKHSADELRRALGDGKQCPFAAVVLDLRNNAGGLLDVAVEICDMFVDEGTIVTTRGRDGRLRSTFEAHRSVVIPRTVPMVVLINRFSASASEILAACLQDHHRAVVIGERSWGKGTVQNLFELEGGNSALKLTTATYWRPSGKNIHRSTDAPENADWGVRPDSDFEIKLTDEQLEAVLRARRDRDLGRKTSPSQQLTTTDATVEKPDTAKTEMGPAESPAVSGDDIQLDKAIEFLEQQLTPPQNIHGR